MRVKSITMLSDSELRRICQILEKSEHPEESLKATFPSGYHHMDEDTVYFGAHSYDYTYELCPVKPSQTEVQDDTA